MVVHTHWILYVHAYYDSKLMNYHNEYCYSMTTQATIANLEATDPINYIKFNIYLIIILLYSTCLSHIDITYNYTV